LVFLASFFLALSPAFSYIRITGMGTGTVVIMGDKIDRRIGKLSAVQVTGLISKRVVGMHSDGGNLYLAVSPGQGASWIFRYRPHGQRIARDMGLGSAGTISLKTAREKARQQREMLVNGIDPIEARNASRAAKRLEDAKAMTFQQCAVAYIAAHQAGWRNPKHAAQWPSTLETYVYPVFGALPVHAVDVGLVTKVLEPIWATRTETASRVRGRIESVLDWAAARGYRQGENPARWRGHLENLLPKKSKVRRVEHYAALPYADIGEFIGEFRQQEGIAARALEFTILTAARTGEVIGATWPEIDLEGRLWIIPAGRMKAGREHRVPLSAPALTILKALREVRQSNFVFPGQRPGRPLGNMAMRQMLKRMGRSDLTVHGFRAAFTDWAAECTNFPDEVRQMALAHTVSDKVEAAYRRGDLFEKRRQLAEAWARYCTAPAMTAEVVAIGAAR
jgi:integrase